MNEANLAIARKVVLWAGLLVAALLFLFPHWRVSSDVWDVRPVTEELGRDFIAFKPFAGPYRPYRFTPRPGTVVYIHHVRQFTEVALALLATFGLRRALKKPTGIEVVEQKD